MTCPDLEEIERSVRGEIDDAAAESLATHLERCPECASLVEEVRSNELFQSDWQRAWAGTSPGSAVDARIPGYRLEREVHRGGQGAVFAAHQESTNRLVAVKLLHQGAFATAQQRRRFEREIDLSASLDHPNIVTIFDSGRTETGELFFAMELVDGAPLHEHLAEHSLTVDERLRLFSSICAAVHHAHQRGILHRDLKPGNILVDRDGQPRVVDFGLAKPLEVSAADGSLETIPGMFVGTLAYASPEQLQEESGGVDVRSDVYGLGVILFQILTGDLPYDTTGALVNVALKILQGEPTRPSSIDPGLDVELDAIVAKALEKRPRDRYQSVAELRTDVESHLRGDPVLARSDSGWYVLRKRFRRHRLGITTAAVVFLSLVVATVVSGVFWHRSATDRDNAIRERNSLREVRDFQVRMIAMANPYAEGRTVTVAELLDSAGRDLAGEYQDQPELRAELEMTVADSYAGLKLHHQAEAHYSAAWELFREQRGEHDPVTLEAGLGRATAMAATRPVEEAERLLVEEVELLREQLGAGHDHTQNAVSALAHFRENQGRLEEAEELFRQVIELDREGEPVDREALIASLQNLGGCLLTQGHPEKAEPILREVFEWREQHKGPEHSTTLTTANILGQTWFYLGRLDEAEEILRHTLEARRRIFGDESWVTCRSLNALGLCLLESDEVEEACGILQEAVRFGRDVHPPHDFEHLRVERTLGGALWQLGRLDEALEVLEGAHAALEEHHGAGHPDAIATLLGISCVLQAGHQFDSAATVFKSVLSVCPDSHPDRESFLAQARLYRGFCLLQIDRLDEAEELFLEAFEALEAELGPTHQRTRIAIEALVGVYDRTGRPEEADRYRGLLAGGSDD